VHFYDATGFGRAGLIEDFYAPGDDLIIYSKRVSGEVAPPVVDIGEASLIDAAFGYRDYASERDFLLACARHFGTRAPRRVLAWACGTGRHLSAFADVGVVGVGVDASETLLAYGRRLVGQRSADPSITFERAHLDEHPALEKVDLSFVLLSSIHQLLTPEAIESHLRQAARLLHPGGLHVIEATHPQDLIGQKSSGTEWTEVRGDRVVDARFRMHLSRMSPSHVVPVTLEVVCSTRSRTRSDERQSMVQESQWFVPDVNEWQAIAGAVPELSLVAQLGDFHVDVPLQHPAAWRLILVFRKL
jgi:ubiquinone/menaquinone biosynthesis C-methylase UbiE